MYKYVLVKRSFYTNYDMIRFDVINLSKIIELIKSIDEEHNEKIIKVLDEYYDLIFQENIKEIILIMKSLFISDKNYSKDKIISGLEVIKKSVVEKEKLYEKYVDYVDNLH